VLKVRSIALLGALSALALLMAGTMAACGGDDDNGDNGARSPAAASSVEPADGDDGGDTGGDTGNRLKLVSKNTLFDKRELRAKAGATTIEHDHEDAGIVHNVHVYKGVDADGEDIGMTELEAGPVTQTLELTLDAGEYFYVCDSHPATMNGRLIVEE
jgi:plastocyanin